MVLAIAISFLCSVMEAVLLSITPSYAASLTSSQPKLAKRIERLKAKVDQPLAAILTLNTIAHTAGAAGVGAQAAVVFGDAAVGAASAVMTLLVLVLSEIIPKTLGATYWRSLTPIVSSTLMWLVRVLKPFIWLSDKLTQLMGHKADDSQYIRDEIAAMATLGHQAGALAADESHIIQSLLKFRQTKLSSVLTPRTMLFKVHKDLSVDQYLTEHGSVAVSRVLIYDQSPDDIIGYVHRSDIMLAYHRLGEGYRLGKLVKSLHTVPETLHVPTLFQRLLQQRMHICLVVDEYGDVQGIVTLEDLIEALVGVEIVDERDQTGDLKQAAKAKYRARVEANTNLIDSHQNRPLEHNKS